MFLLLTAKESGKPLHWVMTDRSTRVDKKKVFKANNPNGKNGALKCDICRKRKITVPSHHIILLIESASIPLKTFHACFACLVALVLVLKDWVREEWTN